MTLKIFIPHFFLPFGKSLKRFSINSSLKFDQFTNEAIWPWTFFVGRFDYRLNFLTSYWSAQIYFFMI